MWLWLLQAKSQQCATLHCPRMFKHWVTQPSALSLTSLSLSLSLTLSLRLPVSLAHPFFETICPWGAYATQRSNTNSTASSQYNPICSKQRNGQEKNRPHKQINNSTPSDSCLMEISPSPIFLFIQFYMRWGWVQCNHIVFLQIIFWHMPYLVFIRFFAYEAKTESLIGTAPPLQPPPEIFRV